MLKKLTIIEISSFDNIKNIGEVFDPSQIIELSIFEFCNAEEQLCIFTNLRSLTIYEHEFEVDFKKFLPNMRFLNYLTGHLYLIE